MPRVTVLMPLFNGIQFIKESLESIQNQTYTDWEFIIVNDFGSDDGCADVVRQYAEQDPRIILVQTQERLGIAASLNLGLDMAKGEYVVRVDVDDPSEPERFAKQVAYMDEHPEICLCSCYCESMTVNGGGYLEKVPTEPERLKAAMLFPNEIRHFGAILRKSFFDDHNLRYDPDYIVEDYELWTRAIMEGALFANIPEVLVKHRWGFGNISIAKGPRLEEEAQRISTRILNWLGVDIEDCPVELLSGWRARPNKFAKDNRKLVLEQGYILLKKIIEANDSAGYCDKAAMKQIMLQRWDWIRQSCGIKFKDRDAGAFDGIKITPVVSVVMPTFKSVADVSRAIDSAEDQTFTDWEMLVVNDFGSDDGTAEIVKMYSLRDPRIRLVQAESRLGLAESLNKGIREARGQYIARMDADDTSMPERFAKQVEFLDAHPEVGICGTWQHHYGKGNPWDHKAEPDPAVQRCRLLFWCDLCHSTLMLRRDMFVSNGLYYDSSAQAEDFELWTRAMSYMQVANIPEVLGDYAEGTGITSKKVRALAEESGEVTRRTLKRVLGMDISYSDGQLLNGWINPISSSSNREEDLGRIKEIFIEIWKKNKRVGFFDRKKLLETLAAKWYWLKDDVDWKSVSYEHVDTIKDVFEVRKVYLMKARYQSFKQYNPTFRSKVKKVIKVTLRPLARFSRKVMRSLMRDSIDEVNRHIENWTWDRYRRLNEDIEHWTWDRYWRTNRDVERWTWDRYQRINEDIKRCAWDICQRINEDIERWTWDRYQRTNEDIERRIWDIYQKINEDIEHWTWDRYLRTNKDIEHWTWDRYLKSMSKLDSRIWKAEQVARENHGLLASLGYDANRVPLKENERIRIVFLFQVASFWPSIDYFYRSVKSDDRFETVLVCYDEDCDPSIKTETSRAYLMENNIEFIPYEDFDIDLFAPHVVVVQTPYDTNRTARYQTETLKSKGYRVVYIPYGIEIADTAHANDAHFETSVVKGCWRMYTLSSIMKRDYVEHCSNAKAVQVLGLPKFDSLFHAENFPLKEEIRKRAAGRKIILWKVHFPKVIKDHGKNVLVTPYINEYISFAKKVREYEDLFFIFMPHPRFKEFNEDPKVQEELAILLSSLSDIENVYIDDGDDYRRSLVNADCVIIDRSAVMVEAGCLGVPVLYMYNPDFKEPMTKAIEPLIESYYQGTECADMESFVDMFRAGRDPKRKERELAFRECIPYFDGKCGERIKEDIVQAIRSEKNEDLIEQFAAQNALLEERISALEDLIMRDSHSLYDSAMQESRSMYDTAARQSDERKDELYASLDKQIERWTWNRYLRQKEDNDEIHNHIEITYRDLMIALNNQLHFAGKHDLILKTDYPIALDSIDTKVPHGTAQDNTRYPRFIKKCESVFGKDKGLSFLDLGCSGGGMVLDAILRGHLGIGLEGSDYSLIRQRAEWRLLRDNLFTCDITKPFELTHGENGPVMRFDVITAWEVLEHIAEDDLPQMFQNIRNHLKPGGLFVGSVACWDDIDPKTGVNWHVTVHPTEWWESKFDEMGFEIVSGLFDIEDMVRGGVNHPISWRKQSMSSSPSYLAVLRVRE